MVGGFINGKFHSQFYNLIKFCVLTASRPSSGSGFTRNFIPGMGIHLVRLYPGGGSTLAARGPLKEKTNLGDLLN